MKDLNSIALSVGGALIAISIAFHIVSCLCHVGNEICIKGCQTRFIFANMIGGTGILLVAFTFSLLHIAKNKLMHARVKHK